MTDTDRPPPLRSFITYSLVIGFVLFVVLAEWNIPEFRGAMGWLAPRLPLLIYVLAAAALAWSLIPEHRRGPADRMKELVTRWQLARLRFLLLPGAMSASIMAFLVPLFGTWVNGFRPPLVLGGIIPYSDGTLWFGGGARLLFDGIVDDYSAKRPLNPALLAVRLALTHMDLRLAMVLQQVLLGVACCLLARVVVRHLGVAAGLTVFAGIFSFTGLFAATIFTEPLGVAFGALAVAALWTALYDRNPRLFACGLFLLAVALSVRAGAFAVLLLLPLWFARSTRDNGESKGRLLDWPALRLGVVAIALGLGVNLAALLATGGSPANLNSNSMYLVYGMAKGYPGWAPVQGWGVVLVEHPEIHPLDDTERTDAVRRLALEAVGDHPSRFAASLVRSELNYLRLAKSSTTFTSNVLMRRGVQAIALIVGAMALYRRRKAGWPPMLIDLGLFAGSLLCLPVLLVWDGLDGLPMWVGGALALVSYAAFVVVGSARMLGPAQSGFLLVSMAGVALSVPIIGTDSGRVLAATAPLMAILPAVAVGVLVNSRRQVPTEADEVRVVSRGRFTPVMLGVGLIVVALLGAPVAAAVVDKPNVAARVCPDGSRAHALLGGSSVRIVANTAAAGRSVDSMDVETATRELELVGGLDAVKPLIRPGVTIVAGISEQGGDRVVFLDRPVRARGTEALYFCGGNLNDITSATFTAVFWPKPVDFAFMTGTPLDP